MKGRRNGGGDFKRMTSLHSRHRQETTTTSTSLRLLQHLQLPVGWSSRWTSQRRAEQTGAEAGQQALDRTHLRHFISDGHRRLQSCRDNQTEGQAQKWLYVGHAALAGTVFFPPLTSLFISFTRLSRALSLSLSLIVAVCFTLSPLLRQLRLNLMFTHQQTAEATCGRQII